MSRFIDIEAIDEDNLRALDIDHVSETEFESDDSQSISEGVPEPERGPEGHNDQDLPRSMSEPEISDPIPQVAAPSNPYDRDDCSAFAKEVTGLRVNAKWVLLTYAALGDYRPAPELLLDFLRRKGACSAIVSVERHRDGSYHWHALAEKATKWDCSLFFFDYDGKHPNIRTVLRGKWEGAEEYVLKDGDYIRWNQREVPATSRNYCKRKQDRETWLRDVRSARYPPPSGALSLPNASGTLSLESRTKRRGIVVVGPANFGKTSWLLHQLRGTRYYQVQNERNPWDQWSNAKVVVWNDAGFWPLKGDLCLFTDVGLHFHQGAFLRARFYDKLLEPGVYTLIILCNEGDWEQCPYRYESWFIERFTVINLRQPWQCHDQNCPCHE